jgi:hypothetical protein
MKKLFTLLTITVLAVNILAQTPQKMSYQCVVRDKTGALITNQNIGVRMSILLGSVIQIIVFQETYPSNPATNENGLLTIDVGSGKASIGEFSSINWSSGPYFLRTEIDPAGGTNYTITGQSQILSVPYALYSEKAGSYAEADPVWNGVSGNYYTKSNLQTSGQASVHWNNLTSLDADVEDLADGSLSGSKIGAGISAANITSGILPLARLSGITTTELSPTAGITAGQISSMAAGKIIGIGDKQVPRGNGTGLESGSIIDDGTNVGIGPYNPGAKLHISNYSGPQLMIGSSNQPELEWYFSVDPVSHLSLINEKRGTPYTALYFDNNNNNIGIGTTGSPTAKLEINGQIKINGGTPAAGEVLTSNASGLATWEPVPAPTVNHIYFEVKLTTDYNWPTIGTVQKIDFSSGGMIWENAGNAFNTANSTFTAPEDGIYSFRGSIHFKSITQGYLIYAFLKAGAKNYNGSWRNASGSSEIVDIDMTVYMAEGETAQLWGYVNDPTPPATVSGNTTEAYAFTFFSGAKVR